MGNRRQKLLTTSMPSISIKELLDPGDFLFLSAGLSRRLVSRLGPGRMLLLARKSSSRGQKSMGWQLKENTLVGMLEQLELTPTLSKTMLTKLDPKSSI